MRSASMRVLCMASVYHARRSDKTGGWVNGLAVMSGDSEDGDGGYWIMLRAAGRTSKLLPD